MGEGFDLHAARQWFIDADVFIRPIGRVIYLAPAFVISDPDLTQLIAAIQHFVETR